jgi:hypothetical protein
MVLLKVNLPRFSIAPLECYAPGTIDVEAVALRLAPERMKVEAGNVEIAQRRSLLQCIESPNSRASSEAFQAESAAGSIVCITFSCGIAQNSINCRPSVSSGVSRVPSRGGLCGRDPTRGFPRMNLVECVTADELDRLHYAIVRDAAVLQKK